MPFQSGNLSGRNNTTGLDTFQPPLSLDGGPDVLLDYFLLYAAFSFALQRPDAFTVTDISELPYYLRCRIQKCRGEIRIFISTYFQLQKIPTLTYARYFSTFVWEGKKFKSLPGFF